MNFNISKSLSQSLKAEKDRIQKINLNKFDIADELLNLKRISTVKTTRDTFSLPQNDHAIIKLCIKKLLKQEISVTKSEIIRMGLKILQQMSDSDLKRSYNLIEKVKTGRPKKG